MKATILSICKTASNGRSRRSRERGQMAVAVPSFGKAREKLIVVAGASLIDCRSTSRLEGML
jgi:hypothetical protein